MSEHISRENLTGMRPEVARRLIGRPKPGNRRAATKPVVPTRYTSQRERVGIHNTRTIGITQDKDASRNGNIRMPLTSPQFPGSPAPQPKRDQSFPSRIPVTTPQRPATLREPRSQMRLGVTSGRSAMTSDPKSPTSESLPRRSNDRLTIPVISYRTTDGSRMRIAPVASPIQHPGFEAPFTKPPTAPESPTQQQLLSRGFPRRGTGILRTVRI